jgi:hypothetical protein
MPTPTPGSRRKTVIVGRFYSQIDLYRRTHQLDPHSAVQISTSDERSLEYLRGLATPPDEVVWLPDWTMGPFAESVHTELTIQAAFVLRTATRDREDA